MLAVLHQILGISGLCSHCARRCAALYAVLDAALRRALCSTRCCTVRCAHERVVEIHCVRLSQTFFLYDSRGQRECCARKMTFRVRNDCAVSRWVLTPCGNHGDSQTCVHTLCIIIDDSLRRRIERLKRFPLKKCAASVLGDDHPGEIASGLSTRSGGCRGDGKLDQTRTLTRCVLALRFLFLPPAR